MGALATPGGQQALWELRRCFPCTTFNCTLNGCDCGCHRPTRCRSCNALVWWGTTASGKRCPYDYDDELHATATSHFATCPQARGWSKRGR
jgi:hypothetical protein